MDRNAAPEIFVGELAKNVERMAAMARRLTPEQLVAPPAQGGWSPNEVLWHIRATADVHDGHIRRILDEDEPRWRHVSPRARMKKVRYHELPFADSLEALEEQRRALVAELQELPPEAWQRLAIVKVEQKEWRLTLHRHVWGYAEHEAGHCVQLEGLAAALE